MFQEAWRPACGLSFSCTNTRELQGPPSLERPVTPQCLPQQGLHALPTSRRYLPLCPRSSLRLGPISFTWSSPVPPSTASRNICGGKFSTPTLPPRTPLLREAPLWALTPWNTPGWLCWWGTDDISHLCCLGHSLQNHTHKVGSNTCWDHGHASGWHGGAVLSLGAPNGQAPWDIARVTFPSSSGVCSELWMF